MSTGRYRTTKQKQLKINAKANHKRCAEIAEQIASVEIQENFSQHSYEKKTHIITTLTNINTIHKNQPLFGTFYVNNWRFFGNLFEKYTKRKK